MSFRLIVPRLIVPVAVALIAAAFAVYRATGADGALEALERRLLDIRFEARGPRAAPDDILIVAVDEATVQDVGVYAPLRAALAEAIGQIAADGPSAIAVDILLVASTGADDTLAAALTGDVPIFLAAAEAPGERDRRHDPSPEYANALSRSAVPLVIRGPDAPVLPERDVILPLHRFAAAARLAHVNVSRARDGVVRQIPLTIVLEPGHHLPSMAVAAAQAMAGPDAPPLRLWPGRALEVGGRQVETDLAGQVILDHFGGPGTIETVSLLDVLSGEIAPGRFAGKAVFIGSTAPSLRDDFTTPYGGNVAGVEVLAGAAANLVEGRLLRRDALTAALSLLLSVAWAVLALLSFRMPRPPVALGANAAAWFGAAASLQAAFAFGLLWIDAVSVLSATFLGSLVGAFIRLRAERISRQLAQEERRNLSRYVSPVLADLLAKQARPLFHRRAQPAAVLFIDVAGYSGFVEVADPVEVAAFLGDLHGFFEDCATRHGGVISDYQGDGAMMIFGLPAPGPDDARNAIACADALLAGAAEVKSPILNGAVLTLRVSVHHGPVAAAVLGGSRHGQVGVTGDTVNVTARLQDVAKEYGARFVTTRPLLEAAGIDLQDNGGIWQMLVRAPMRGRKQPVEIWRRASA